MKKRNKIRIFNKKRLMISLIIVMIIAVFLPAFVPICTSDVVPSFKCTLGNGYGDGGGDSCLWSEGSDGDIYYNGGNVGIGTTTPGAKLDVAGNLKVDAPHSHIHLVGSGNGVIQVVGGILKIGYWPNGGNDDLNIDLTNHRVGIGTTDPAAKLDVAGGTFNTAFAVTGSEEADYTFRIINKKGVVSAITQNLYYTTQSEWANDRSGKGATAIAMDNGKIELLTTASNDEFPTSGVYINNNGNVGIGTTTPGAKLDVVGNLKVTTDHSHIHLVGDSGNGVIQVANGLLKIGHWPNGGSDDLNIDLANHRVGIGTTAPTAKLTIRGYHPQDILLQGKNYNDQLIFEIGEGLDYAETFPISHDEITPGTVVAIDPYNTGSLKISTEAYDKGVAGIVSGANDLGYGVRLGADEVNGYPVALAGRVYCNVDTQYGDIKPCDLLTTSPTPGHAMVVKDYNRAQGAILGKAMEGLSGGETGQILVLVTLQ